MEQKPLPDFRDTREQAGEILSQKSNRLKLIEGFVLCVMPVLLTIVLAALLDEIQRVASWGDTAKLIAVICFNVFSAVFHLFLTVPLTVGLIGMAERIAEGEYVSLVEIFEPFSSGESYRRAFGVAFRLFWTVGLLVLAVSLTVGFFPAIGKGFGIALLTAIFAVAEIILWLVFAMRRFATVSFVFLRRTSFRKAKKATARMAGYSRNGGIVWLLNFLPWTLLGFLTVGILLLADVLPRMCISYHLYCKKLIENANLSEGSDHE